MQQLKVLLLDGQVFTAVLIELNDLIWGDTLAEQVHIDSNEVLFGVEGEEVLPIVKLLCDLGDFYAFLVSWSVFYLKLAVQNNDG